MLPGCATIAVVTGLGWLLLQVTVCPVVGVSVGVQAARAGVAGQKSAAAASARTETVDRKLAQPQRGAHDVSRHQPIRRERSPQHRCLPFGNHRITLRKERANAANLPFPPSRMTQARTPRHARGDRGRHPVSSKRREPFRHRHDSHLGRRHDGAIVGAPPLSFLKVQRACCEWRIARGRRSKIGSISEAPMPGDFRPS